MDLRGRLSNPTVQTAIDRLLTLLDRAEQDHFSINGAAGLEDHKGKTVLRPPYKLVHRLTDDMIRRLTADYEQGSSVKELVERYRISKTSVLGLLHDHGVEVRASRRLTDADLRKAADLYRAGWSTAKIGGHLDVGAETIRQSLRQVGVAMRGCRERPSARRDGTG